MRAHPEPIGRYSPLSRPLVQPVHAVVPTVLFVVPEAERTLYLGDAFTRVFAQSANEAARFILNSQPRVVVVDMDAPALGGMDVCAAAHGSNTSVLVTTGIVEGVPAMLKAGCHGVLLKPFTPVLMAARLGRVIKETERPWSARPLPPGWSTGTNRVWPETACPKCGVRGPTSFDFSSYRRMWYACLSCDTTWLGPRQE